MAHGARTPTASLPRSKRRSSTTPWSAPRTAPSASPTSFASRASTSAPPGSGASGCATSSKPTPSAFCASRHAQDETLVLSEAQIELLERHSVDFRCRHIETSRPGELLNQDTFYWGTLKGVGKVYVQVVVDTFCSLAFAKVYNSKMPVTACDLLYDRVLPFYEALGIQVGAVLTDNGREFCGRPEKHPYELLLALEDIEHRTTKVRSPRTNGFVERMNRTLLDECFRVAGRTTWYERIEEIQADLDRFLAYYNLEPSSLLLSIPLRHARLRL